MGGEVVVSGKTLAEGASTRTITQQQTTILKTLIRQTGGIAVAAAAAALVEIPTGAQEGPTPVVVGQPAFREEGDIREIDAKVDAELGILFDGSGTDFFK